MKKIPITIDDINPVEPHWLYKTYQTYQDQLNYNNPCANCGNNPANNPNASGFCCCSLPSMMNIRY
jgi:hypothetical protein